MSAQLNSGETWLARYLKDRYGEVPRCYSRQRTPVSHSGPVSNPRPCVSEEPAANPNHFAYEPDPRMRTHGPEFEFA